MGDANSIAGQLLVTPSLVHSSRSVQCNQTVQFTKTAFTHFSLFFGGPSLSTRDQDRERDFMGDANSIVGQQLVTHLLFTVQDLFNTVCQSRFQNSFHTLPFVFLVDQVLVSQIKTEKETLWVTPTPLQVSSQSHHLLCTVQDLSSATRQSSLPKQLSHTSLCFLVDQVLAPEIKTEKETLWVMPTPLWVSNQLPISCSQFKICSTQYVSPDSKTTFTHFSLFFGGPSLSITDQD